MKNLSTIIAETVDEHLREEVLAAFQQGYRLAHGGFSPHTVESLQRGLDLGREYVAERYES